jgi:signal transduction histidine kinase/HAMP domain-containing protein
VAVRLKVLANSLGFQAGAALIGLALLFAAGGLYAVSAFQRQLAYDALVNIAGRLELAAEHMHSQGMNYKQNAPRDYPTYYRDVRLYYRDLMAHVATFDQVVDTFMTGDFRGGTPDLMPWIHPRVGAGVEDEIRRLEEIWQDYRRGLFAALGDDSAEPRLEWAAEHVIAEHGPLREAAGSLAAAMEAWAGAEARQVTRGALMLALAPVLVAMILLAALRIKVLSPLRATIQGFQRVAEGDFHRPVNEAGTSEIVELTRRFNALGLRLDLLYRLIDGLQRGNDVEELVQLLSGEFRELLGFDWIGVVFVDEARGRARVDTCWMDGAPQPAQRLTFRLEETLLAEALSSDGPLHVQDMPAEAEANPAYELLRHLVSQGMRACVFLPVTRRSQSPIPAVVVFATRDPQRMDAAQRRFLGNIAELLIQAFGRTARLAEQARLASIGEFASGIAHEVRTPLSTVAMALEHMAKQPLEKRAQQRVDLGIQEAARIRRLLEDILLYAKPLHLQPEPVDVTAAVTALVEEAASQLGPLRIAAADERPRALLDRDRLRQVFDNLTENARQAAPEGSEVLWQVTTDHEAGRVIVSVHNGGEPIPANLLPRITEPFVSHRANGTGLGLAIVRRLVEQQGGEIRITSSHKAGTEVRLSFPLIGPEP